MYQKLVDLIYDVPLKGRDDRLDFFERAFITELSEVSSRSSNEADAELRKASVSNRVGEKLLKHPFFRKFPMVVLAVGSYVGRRDFRVSPCEIFNVEGPVEKTVDRGNGRLKDKIRIYSGENSRVVIHTRQLSSYVSNALLKEMASILKGR